MSTSQLTSFESPVYFVSLGCSKNLVDSEVMLGKLKQSQYNIVKDPSDAEVIIVNTCSFIQAAKEESINTILEMADYKVSGKCKALVVSGCLAQRYSKDIEKDMPEVDLMIGTGQYHRITEFLDERNESIRLGGKLPKRAYIDQPAFIHSETDERTHTGPKYAGYLKLSEGCNRRCSFCIIPDLRGNVRSRSVDSLVNEARRMGDQGIRELNLVAQDLTHYGIENRYRENLKQLLPKLCEIETIDWIRLHYVYPDQFTDELLEIIATQPKIVKYLDMPIQHTNDRVLKLMNRSLKKERLFELIGELRERVPEMVFRTSIIVGFPGETDAEFEELCDDLVKLNLDHVGVFRYSHEEGTKASTLSGQLPEAVKRKRSQKLIALLQEQALQRQGKYLGRRVPVLVEGVSTESELLLQGRMPAQAMGIDGNVLINDIEGFSDVGAGDLVDVEITETLPYNLVGRVVNVASKWKSASGGRVHA
ncbi:MAG: 30S ribosomal protein S12 methylthiotransferase RimO [Bacteriovoracia bacterium]